MQNWALRTKANKRADENCLVRTISLLGADGQELAEILQKVHFSGIVAKTLIKAKRHSDEAVLVRTTVALHADGQTVGFSPVFISSTHRLLTRQLLRTAGLCHPDENPVRVSFVLDEARLSLSLSTSLTLGI